MLNFPTGKKNCMSGECGEGGGFSPPEQGDAAHLGAGSERHTHPGWPGRGAPRLQAGPRQPAAQAVGLHRASGCALPAKGAGGSPGGYYCAGRGAEVGSGLGPCSLPCGTAVPCSPSHSSPAAAVPARLQQLLGALRARPGWWLCHPSSERSGDSRYQGVTVMHCALPAVLALDKGQQPP